MKLLIFLIVFLFNFLNQSLMKSEEKIESTSNISDTFDKVASPKKDKTEIRKIHIVKIGDTIISISKLYSINKDLIIKLNNLKDENYIFVGQNLIISDSDENSSKQPRLINSYHIVKFGENLTEISNKYNLSLQSLIEINNLKNPNSIEVGEKLLLSKNEKNSDFLNLNRKIYGPISIESESLKEIKGRKVLNVINQKNKKLILSINCASRELDVRIPGRKWMGGQPPKEEFEKNLINDFC